MNREQIIQMARDAGAEFDPRWGIAYNCGTATFERFAAAIRAATKEEDSKICEEEADSWTAWPQAGAAKRKIVEAIRASK